ILPVNPKHRTAHGVLTYPDIKSLPLVPDLAVICTPAATVPAIISALGEKGTRAAVVISSGFREVVDGKTSLQQEMLDAAKPYDLRILGPNCLGLLIPTMGLNASFAHTYSLPGKIALVSQSGAICTAILDWAKSRGIGFSYFISLGNIADVDFGDLLDYLGTDRHTTGILLYVESIRHARKFMSAARATSRNKPIIVIKSGRVSEGAIAATSHTGALAGNDDVFDAAIKRAGMLRVYSIQNLFEAVETLAHPRPIRGNRMIIMTNGGGVGVLATDSLVSGGGQLAGLSPETLESLSACLPASWSKANPVDIIGDGDAERYVDALRILLRDPNFDAVLVMLVPTAVVDNASVARAVAEEIKHTTKPVFTCWMGEAAVEEARDILEQNNIPSFETPESAVRAFMQIVEYGRNQENLMEIPPSIPEEFQPDSDRVRTIINRVLSEGRDLLSEPEAKEVLAAYDIPVAETLVAKDVDGVIQAAETVGYPVALKILSKDVTHKSDVGGVLLDIDSPNMLRIAVEGMQAHIANSGTDIELEGFTVQRMVHKRNAYELIVGVTTDPIFGPVILFGQGGTSVEVVRDHAVALPPLNMKLASDLIERTKIYRILKGYRGIPPADLEAIELTLVKISQLIIDHAELLELDINPLLSDSRSVIALDARIKIQATTVEPAARLAIRPYPRELEETFVLGDGTDALVRPIKPEDEPAHHEFLRNTKPRDIYFRFFRAVNNLSHSQMARFTQIDYDREMAFIVVIRNEKGEKETAGVIRAVSDA
ncbi:MAG TPA: acetate--CoA ligase family protein, partial [Gammaproteobacteria bacterium]|nr:acetate--CoA ligase family protein [Gammaproteobacteria bacterium]